MDLNRASILGRLTRDPEVKSLSTGKTVTTFSVATSRVWKDASGQKQQQAEYHNVVMWGKLAETAGQYLKKASRVYIEGRLQTRDWVGKDDNVKRYRTEIVADNMIMLDGRPTGESTGTSSYSSAPSPAPQEVVEEEIKVEDIPF